MIYWQIFLAFFIPGIIGYGGGPSSIPLVEYEVVHRYGWLSIEEFGEVLALGNALPGPIATKMAAYIGFSQAGLPGATIGVFAAVAPSIILMIALLGILYKYKDSPKVKNMTMLIRPAIAVLLGILAFRFFRNSHANIGLFQTSFLAAISYFLLEKTKIHPAIIIAGALVYGALFIRIAS
jgi:chromate transporter